MLKRLSTLGAVLLLSLLVVGSSSAQDDGEDLPFFLSFIPNVQFAPVYVAIENGYFAAAGYNLVVDYPEENVALDLIASNEVQFGVISGEQVVLARDGGRPVVYVYEWYQQYPVGIVIPDTSGIETLADLAGRSVGIPGRFGASYFALIALLQANGLTEDDIDLEEIGFNAADIVCAGNVEASVVYVNNEPLQIQQRADAGECGDITSVSVIPVAESVDLVSNGIVTNEETRANNPDLVQTVVDAFHAGLQDTINNPAQAYLLSLNHVENLPIDDEFRAALESAAEIQTAFLEAGPDRAAVAESRDELLSALEEQGFDDDMLIQFKVLLESIRLWDADQLGFSDPVAWETTQQILLSMGGLADPIDLTAAFTNDFVPVMGE